MIANNNNIHNSINFNPVKDDLTYRGYMALAYAVCGVKDCNGRRHIISLQKIRRIFGLKEQDIDDKNENQINKIKTKKQVNRDNKTFKYKNVRLVDVHTGEVTKIFNNVLEASKFLGMTDTRVNLYIRKGYVRDKKYKIEADLNPDYVKGASLRRKIRAINVNNESIKEYDSVDEASKDCGLSSTSIYMIARDKKISRDGWKFEYIED